MRDLHTRHVAAVTEAAVRAQVAADIEVKRAEAALAATAYREAGDESAEWEASLSAHAYGYAARMDVEGHQLMRRLYHGRATCTRLHAMSHPKHDPPDPAHRS